MTTGESNSVMDRVTADVNSFIIESITKVILPAISNKYNIPLAELQSLVNPTTAPKSPTIKAKPKSAKSGVSKLSAKVKAKASQPKPSDAPPAKVKAKTPKATKPSDAPPAKVKAKASQPKTSKASAPPPASKKIHIKDTCCYIYNRGDNRGTFCANSASNFFCKTHNTTTQAKKFYSNGNKHPDKLLNKHGLLMPADSETESVSEGSEPDNVVSEPSPVKKPSSSESATDVPPPKKSTDMEPIVKINQLVNLANSTSADSDSGSDTNSASSDGEPPVKNMRLRFNKNIKKWWHEDSGFVVKRNGLDSIIIGKVRGKDVAPLTDKDIKDCQARKWKFDEKELAPADSDESGGSEGSDSSGSSGSD